MEENRSSFPDEANAISSVTHNDHGWQKVTYAKRQKKTKNNNSQSQQANANVAAVNGSENVFRSIERQSQERRRRIREVRRAADAGIEDIPFVSKQQSDYEDEDDDDHDADVDAAAAKNGKAEDAKKVKKPKVTVAEAAAKIDAADLEGFLADISVGSEMCYVFRSDFDLLV